jgi:hypothetical protein
VAAVTVALLLGALAPQSLAETSISCSQPSSSEGPGSPAAAARTYAGISGREGHGVAATILTLRPTEVSPGGFVAAWVGISSESQWLQTGFVDTPGRRVLWVEYRLAGGAICYGEFAVDPNRAHRFTVLERASEPGTWRAWLDGRPISEPVVFSGSLQLHATVESRVRAGMPVNRYAFRFTGVRVARVPGGVWRPFPATDTSVRDRTLLDFTAASP